MGPFEFAFCALLLVFGYRMAVLVSRNALESKRLKAGDEFIDRLAKLERRIENLETIVIERDKKSEFERL